MNNTPRVWKSEGFFPFRVEMLTPVYIGSGETLSPLDYVIRKEDDNYKLWLVDVGAWLSENTHDNDIQRILNTDDVNRIRALFHEKIDVQLYGICASSINAQLAKRFEQNIQGRGGKTLEIDAFLRNPLLKNLIIPGSSLKGALSTPIIDGQNALFEKLRLQGKPTLKQNYSSALMNMFGSIGEHAMQGLKVADTSIPASYCHIVSAEECSIKANKQPTPKNPCEAVFTSQKYYASFILDCRTGKPAIDLSKQGASALSFQAIQEKCTTFYKKRFDAEMSTFYMQPHLAHVRQDILNIQKRLEDALNTNSPPILLRLGRYSHVECLTVTANAPKGRSFKGGKPVFGTTRTLANGKLPFGWILLHPCSLEEYTQGMQDTEKSIQQEFAQAQTHHQEHKAKIALQKQALEQERRAQEEAAQKAQEEEEKRLAAVAAEEERLSKLSPAERKIAELYAPSATENTAKELLDALDGFEAELQYKAAEALKEYWEKLQKWSGKMSKKQQEKVQKVQNILAKKS